jgi:hypothetical protein
LIQKPSILRRMEDYPIYSKILDSSKRKREREREEKNGF